MNGWQTPAAYLAPWVGLVLGVVILLAVIRVRERRRRRAFDAKMSERWERLKTRPMMLAPEPPVLREDLGSGLWRTPIPAQAPGWPEDWSYFVEWSGRMRVTAEVAATAGKTAEVYVREALANRMRAAAARLERTTT